MGIIEPNFVGQNQNVVQEVHSAVALYWTHPEFGSSLIIWNLCDLMELSVLYFAQKQKYFCPSSRCSWLLFILSLANQTVWLHFSL